MRSFPSFLCIAGVVACAVGCSSDSQSSGSYSDAEAGAGGAAETSSNFGGNDAGAEGGTTGEDGAGGADEPANCTLWGPIEADETWGPTSDCPDGFDVPANLEIRGPGTVLTVEPATKLKFGRDAMLQVMPGAALTAIGTAAEPIVFTGWQQRPGSWGGILVHSNALGNEISHAIVEYAGSEDGASGNVTMSSDGGGHIKLTSTVLRYGARFGLTVLETGGLDAFADNTITENDGGAIRVQIAVLQELNGSGNVITGNGKDNQIALEELSTKIEGDVTWPSLSPAIYRVMATPGIGSNIRIAGHVTIEAGAQFEFIGGSGIAVTGGAAGLAAVGNKDNPIIFRGVDGSGWSGIGYCESNWTVSPPPAT